MQIVQYNKTQSNKERQYIMKYRHIQQIEFHNTALNSQTKIGSTDKVDKADIVPQEIQKQDQSLLQQMGDIFPSNQLETNNP